MKSTNPEQLSNNADLEAANGNTAINPESIGSATTPDEPAFGWSAYAERVNGRFAMIGFVAVLLIEAFSNDAFLHWAGLIR